MIVIVAMSRYACCDKEKERIACRGGRCEYDVSRTAKEGY